MSNNARGVLPHLFPDKDVPSASESESGSGGLLPTSKPTENLESANSFAERIWASVARDRLIGQPAPGEAK